MRGIFKLIINEIVCEDVTRTTKFHAIHDELNEMMGFLGDFYICKVPQENSLRRSVSLFSHFLAPRLAIHYQLMTVIYPFTPRHSVNYLHLSQFCIHSCPMILVSKSCSGLR
jgi:hypothetical protein